MAAFYEPTEDEYYLYALLTDPAGIDLAEFAFIDEDKPDACFRLWDFQWAWYRTEDQYQIEQASRTLGKSLGVAMRACTHPFIFPAQERLITGPELNHIKPLTGEIEKKLKSVWFLRAMLPSDRHMGISKVPQWQVTFLNGAEIRTRLPGKYGIGLKGQHPVVIEVDEGQDFPEAGWAEIIECLKEVKGAQFRVHGVPKGARDRFWRYTTGQDPALPWKVHRILAMSRPTWSDLERRRKIALYGGARTNPDYRRNIYGEHGDHTSPLFVLARLLACVDQDEASDYNMDVYTSLSIVHEDLDALRAGYDMHDPEAPSIETILAEKIPSSLSQGYNGFVGGGDVGLTNHPSEFLVFGQVPKTDVLRLLLRIHLERIATDDQQAVLLWLREFFGSTFRFGIDRAGLGQGVYQPLSTSRTEEGVLIEHAKTKSWLVGWDFGEKVVISLDTDVTDGTVEDQFVYRNFLDYSSEELRTFVDAKKIQLPNDTDLINQWQGQTWTTMRGSDVDPNRPKRRYSAGAYHVLDAGKYMIATKTLPPLHEMINAARNERPESADVVFPGAMMG